MTGPWMHGIATDKTPGAALVAVTGWWLAQTGPSDVGLGLNPGARPFTDISTATHDRPMVRFAVVTHDRVEVLRQTT